ncbi:UPF0223 family protein [Amphibacillus sp. MSJ-3]|uniref:UPF0223 family protein n=1 Tax=Amphibacillus sp. MSJ-3 TaxID=2841505 RepID=UPI001C0EE93F|nr:UPF0223 family protein [Amphibacillus sp. MSJ-3]MBU5595568.1 UPF0223 family protein [Amphibacillus sp. MSJ-3]
MSYHYPIDPSWSTEETIVVVEFLVLIEKAYQGFISRTELLNQYRAFKKIVPSKSEEKTIDKEFERVSGCSLYRTIQKARKEDSDRLKMNEL